MADASISQLIVLVVSLSIAATVGGMVMQSAGMISGSIEDQSRTVSRQIETDIEIINDPQYMFENVNGGDNNLVLYVKNTGSEKIENSYSIIDVFVDGIYLSEENIKRRNIIGDTTRWRPSRVLKIVTDYTKESLDGVDHRVKLMVYNNEDTLKFRIEQ